MENGAEVMVEMEDDEAEEDEDGEEDAESQTPPAAASNAQPQRAAQTFTSRLRRTVEASNRNAD